MGDENLSKPAIQRLVQQLMNTRSERTQATADYVITIVETIERSRKSAPVLDRKGIRSLLRHRKVIGACVCLRLQGELGKHLNLLPSVMNSRARTVTR